MMRKPMIKTGILSFICHIYIYLQCIFFRHRLKKGNKAQIVPPIIEEKSLLQADIKSNITQKSPDSILNSSDSLNYSRYYPF
jgi:hypothetical protein